MLWKFSERNDNKKKVEYKGLNFRFVQEDKWLQ